MKQMNPVTARTAQRHAKDPIDLHADEDSRGSRVRVCQKLFLASCAGLGAKRRHLSPKPYWSRSGFQVKNWLDNNKTRRGQLGPLLYK